MSHYLYPAKEITLKWPEPTNTAAQMYVTVSRYAVLDFIVAQLQAARTNAITACAPNLTQAIRDALKSAEGARRHAEAHGWDDVTAGRRPSRKHRRVR